MKKILAINPGGTSTKIAIFDGDTLLYQKQIQHKMEDLIQYKHVIEQFEYRYTLVLSSLHESLTDMSSLNAVVARGGMLYSIESGTYSVNDIMINDLKAAKRGEHASNLGAMLAYKIANDLGIPSFIVDPVSVDEFEDVARVSGLKELPRVSLSHALNSKAIARKAADAKGKSYELSNIIVAHLGTGISVSAHKNGRMIDVNNAQEEGPFSSDRCGTVPSYRLVKMCFSGLYTENQLLKMLEGSGGLNSLVGMKDIREIELQANAGNADADLALRALTYQIAKEIGAIATVLNGKVDCIALTGGMVYSDRIVNDITRRVEFISNVLLFPGEQEMTSLASGALRVLNGEEAAKNYRGAAQC
ncbi:putative butyrate kinase [uncultured spirochete]|uniref:Probable butyrate kinase n=1 Tax=uncultured spirochete TaxID=156406 RepID=A0A3P3XPN7_9SPIR|nr:putative butyrate kinase [uncultured spirochete]